MATHPRLGSCLLVADLGADAFGTLHRGVIHQGPVFGSHRLVRAFSRELAAAGLGDRLAQAARVMATLAPGRSFPEGFLGEGGGAPHASWVHLGGRTLAAVLERASAESFPVDQDQAMAAVLGVAQGLVQMHGRGLSHGVLSPHSAWITYEGAVVLVDAPWAAVAADLLPSCPDLRAQLAPYLAGDRADPLQRDLTAFGALAFEVLTQGVLPPPGDRATALAQATLPPELRNFLARLVLPGDPFPTLEAFREGLDRAAHCPGVDPSAFGLAFLMHALFREEVARDAVEEEAERVASYLAYTPDGEAILSGAHLVQAPPARDPEPAPAPAAPSGPVPRRGAKVAAAIAALVLVGLGGVLALRVRAERNLQHQRTQLEELRAQILREKADLEARARQEAARTTQLEQQLARTRTAEDRARVQRQLEESQVRRQEVARQQKVAEQRLAEQVPSFPPQQAQAPAPAAAPPPLVQEPPRPATGAPAASEPAAPVPSGVAQAPVLEPARIQARTVPAYPAAALLRRDLAQEVSVRLKVQVGEAGQPLRIAVVDGVPGGHGFDEAAVAAARSSTYSPALRDGKPVRAWTEEIVYKFQRRR